MRSLGEIEGKNYWVGVRVYGLGRGWGRGGPKLSCCM